MLKAILGKKLGQRRIFSEDGKQIPVTEIKAGPCTVVQIKKIAKDGYWALQLGFDHQTIRNITKPLRGHLKKTGKGNYLPRFLHEVKIDVAEKESEKDDQLAHKIGEQIVVDKVLQVGDRVKVTGITKAKGFQGVMKRHGFAGGPRTHGQSDRQRAPGSIGQTTTPGRVYKGKRMAGRMGGNQHTVTGLKVVKVDTEKNRVWVKGLVPGNISSYLVVTKY